MNPIIRRAGFLGLALVASLLAFRVDEPDLSAVFARINEEVLQRGRAYQTLNEATSTIGHRLTGSPNGTRAEQYAHDLLRSYGLDVKFVPFEVEAWSRDTVTLSVGPPKSDNLRVIPVVSLAHSPVKATLQGDIVDAGNGLESDFEAVKDQVKGRIALVNIGISPPNPALKNLHRSEKTALAIRYGAAGIIIVNQVKNNVLLTGTASVTGKLIPIPAVCISLESGAIIREWMKEEKTLAARIEMSNFSRKIRARNVVATLRGSDLPKEKILIGGHLDSWDLATGAIDNGIGSFAILDIARTFGVLQLKPRRTIEFVMFMGEEQGLLGSEALIRQLVKDKSIGRVRYMVNLDMANNPVGFNACGREEMVPFFREVGEKIKAVDPAFANVNANRSGLHSDHQGFMLEGVPVTMPSGSLSADVLGCYHADCDRFNLVNQEHLNNTVRFTAMMLYALADADQIPARKLDNPATRDFLVKQGLQNELEIGGDWRW
ncbi:MAG: M28 family peptidase [Ferruginibacter sp.]|nr:M28 family peptidase [Cytophagales bacterium]